MNISKENEIYIGLLNQGEKKQNKLEIPSFLIENFLSAIDEKNYNTIELENLGITIDYLKTIVDESYKKEIEKSDIKDQIELKEQYRDLFLNISLVENIIPNVFRSRYISDYPEINVTVKMKSKEIFLSSFSQTPFMIPWTIKEENSSETISFNPNISRSLEKILPEEFIQKIGISDVFGLEKLISFHSNRILRKLRPNDYENILNLLGTRLSLIKENYEIKKHYIDHFKVGEDQYHAYLHPKAHTLNLKIYLSISYDRTSKILGDLTPFLSNIQRLVNLTLSVSWLKNYLNSNSIIILTINFTNNTSISSKDREIFSQNMKEIGKDRLLQELTKNFDQICHIKLEKNNTRSEWFVLPNKTAILWKFLGDEIGPWASSDFSFINNQYLSGQAISEDGKFIQ